MRAVRRSWNRTWSRSSRSSIAELQSLSCQLQGPSALGPGSVEDSASTPAVGQVVVADEDDLEPFSPEGSTSCQSRASTTGGDSGEDWSMSRTTRKQRKMWRFSHLQQRRGKWKTLLQPESSQKRTGHHPRPHSFYLHSPPSRKRLTKHRWNMKRKRRRKQWWLQAKLEQDHIWFESELSVRLQQSSSTFQ